MHNAAAKAKQGQTSFPLSPAAPNAEEVSRFKFDTLSPDETVLEAQKRATGSAEAGTGSEKQQQRGGAVQATRKPSPITDGKLHSTSNQCMLPILQDFYASIYTHAAW